MGFLDRLFGRSLEKGVLWLYVRCDKCGAKVRVRVNLYNDLSLTDDGGYILRKEIMDNQCYQLMHAELRFDGGRRVTSRDVSGGEFITKEEYESTDES
jgi:hypothetical protein